jgi:MFS family permease
MLAETFPASRRAFAVGAYYAGVPIGAGLGLVIASVLVPTLGWRSCFYVLGGVGLVFVVALLFVKEPRDVRRAAGAPSAAVPTLSSILADLKLALRTSPALWLVMLGGSGVAYASGAAIHAVTWIVQERGVPFGDAAFRGGVIIATAGLTGNFLGGWFDLPATAPRPGVDPHGSPVRAGAYALWFTNVAQHVWPVPPGRRPRR